MRRELSTYSTFNTEFLYEILHTGLIVARFATSMKHVDVNKIE